MDNGLLHADDGAQAAAREHESVDSGAMPEPAARAQRRTRN
jgi:hypothetical protein